jgi:quercetin dioxygenase-like cupin family protein
MRKFLLIAAVAFAAGLAGFHQQVIIGAPTEPVTYHDMATIPPAPYGPYPDARAVLTDTSSVVLASVPAKWRQTPHHHNQEQITLGIGGALGYSIGGVTHQLGSHGAGLPRPNVEHGMSNDADQPASMMEYQPVLRAEWLPPHPQVPPQPQSPQAMPTPTDQQVTLDFDVLSDGWHVEKNGARVKTLTGKTIRANFWDLSKAGASVDLAEEPSLRERLAFVLNGRVSSAVGMIKRDIGREMLVEVRPSAKDVTLTSLGQGPALVVVFETTTP